VESNQILLWQAVVFIVLKMEFQLSSVLFPKGSLSEPNAMFETVLFWVLFTTDVSLNVPNPFLLMNV